MRKINFKEWEFEFQQRNNQPVLMEEFWSRAIASHFDPELNYLHKITGFDVDKLDYIFTTAGKGYVKSEQKKMILAAFREASKKNSYLTHIKKSTLAAVDELDKFADKVTEKLKNNLSDSDLLELWDEFTDQFVQVIPWFWFPWYITETNILTDRVKTGLEKHKIEDMDNALLVLIFPVKKAMFQLEQKALYELIRFKGDDFELGRKKEEYLKNFAWLKTFMLLPIEPLSKSELDEKILEGKSGDFIEKYEKQQKENEKNAKRAQELTKSLQSDKELISIVKWAQDFGWFLTFSIEKALQATAKLITFYKEIAKRIKVPYEQFSQLTIEEIRHGLAGNLLISEIEFRGRVVGGVYFVENGKIRSMYGAEAKKESDEIESSIGIIDKDISEIKGQIACKGEAKGAVRIALIPSEAAKVNEGDILVCSMTSPEYVPAMKRAAAIVTDEGGLLCHAAIISRELGKVCVIGTKIATQVLKDGMEVEVDADKGIVRIIK